MCCCLRHYPHFLEINKGILKHRHTPPKLGKRHRKVHKTAQGLEHELCRSLTLLKHRASLLNSVFFSILHINRSRNLRILPSPPNQASNPERKKQYSLRAEMEAATRFRDWVIDLGVPRVFQIVTHSQPSPICSETTPALGCTNGISMGPTAPEVPAKLLFYP